MARRTHLALVSAIALTALSLSGCSGGDDDGGSANTGGAGQGAATGSGGSGANGGSGNVGNNGGSGNVGNSGGGGNVGAGEPPALAGITDAHNQARATEGVPPLTWDPALAAIAQAWAEACVDKTAPTGLIDHNEGRSDNYPEYVGENIYGASGAATPQAAVSSWMSEKANYDYASGKCAAGKVCGHYTQVMWAKSTKLGCGTFKCPGLKFGSAIVCDYAPGGNNGGKPF
ncbi:MAG: CAP domain-containing protein [Polyangiaceae bacterium]